MATGNKAAIEAMKSHLLAMGQVRSVVIGEPIKNIQDGLVAIMLIDGEYDESTLGQPREIHRVALRMYQSVLQQNQEQIEFTLDQFRADIMQDIVGDFTLGGNVAYIEPDEFAWTYDKEEIGNQEFRFVNCLIGYRVDEQATFAP